MNGEIPTSFLADGIVKAETPNSVRRRILSLFRRSRWVLIDQILSSASNFFFALVVVRSVPARAFGAFAFAFVLYQFLLSLSRALASEPLTIRYSAAKAEELRVASKSSSGLALSFGIATGAILISISFLGSSITNAAMLPLAVCLPLLLLQDAWRYVFFAGGSPQKAAMNDLVWVVFQVTIFAVLILTRNVSVTSLTLGWGAAAAMAAIFGSVQAVALPTPSSCLTWAYTHRALGMGLTTDSLVKGAAAQLSLLGIGAVSGVAAIGAVRACLVLFGPLYVLLQGSVVLAVPEAVRLRHRSAGRLMSAAWFLGLTLCATATLWGVCLLLLPDRFGRALLGDSWTSAQPLISAVTVLVVAAAALVPPAVGLRALASMRGIVTAGLLAAPATVLLATGGAWLGDAQGGAVGLATGNCMFAVITWWQFLRAERRTSVPKGVRAAPHTARG